MNAGEQESNKGRQVSCFGKGRGRKVLVVKDPTRWKTKGKRTGTRQKGNPRKGKTCWNDVHLGSRQEREWEVSVSGAGKERAMCGPPDVA